MGCPFLRYSRRNQPFLRCMGSRQTRFIHGIRTIYHSNSRCPIKCLLHRLRLHRSGIPGSATRRQSPGRVYPSWRSFGASLILISGGRSCIPGQAPFVQTRFIHGFVPFTIQTRGARLNVYSIGSVCESEYRGQRLAGSLLEECIRHGEASGILDPYFWRQILYTGQATVCSAVHSGSV